MFRDRDRCVARNGVAAGLPALTSYLMGLTAIPIATSGGIFTFMVGPFIAAIVGCVATLIARKGINAFLDS